MIDRLKSLYSRGYTFITRDLWDLHLKAQTKRRARLVWLLRVITLTVKGFRDDRCQMRASALTYVTMLGIVPILATMFAVAGAFDLDQHLRAQADRAIAEVAADRAAVAEMLTKAADAVFNVVQDASPRIMGGIGVLFLLYAVVTMLGTIEKSFNEIWGVTLSRPFLRKVADYLSAVVVMSVLLAVPALVSGTLAGLNEVPERLAKYGLGESVAWLISIAAFFIPCIGFMLVNKFLPNTKVHWVPALFGGLVGGVVWNLSIKLVVSMGIGVANVNRLYGTLAFLPFALIWLQLNWLIVLLSAELTYAVQNEHSYVRRGAWTETTHAAREGMAIAVMAPIALHFHEGRRGWTPDALSDHLDAPLRIVNDVMERLCSQKILVMTSGEHPLYIPARSLDTISLAEIIKVIGSYTDEPHAFGPIHRRAIEIQQRIRQAGSAEIKDVTALDLALLAEEEGGSSAAETPEADEEGQDTPSDLK